MKQEDIYIYAAILAIWYSAFNFNVRRRTFQCTRSTKEFQPTLFCVLVTFTSVLSQNVPLIGIMFNNTDMINTLLIRDFNLI